MQKINSFGSTPDGQFQQSSEPFTYVSADWANAVQGELIAVIEAAGFELDASNNAQVAEAIQSFIKIASAALKSEYKSIALQQENGIRPGVNSDDIIVSSNDNVAMQLLADGSINLILSAEAVERLGIVDADNVIRPSLIEDGVLIVSANNNVLMSVNDDGSINLILSNSALSKAGLSKNEIRPTLDNTVVVDIDNNPLLTFEHGKFTFNAPIVAEVEKKEIHLILGYGQSYMSLNADNGNYSYTEQPNKRTLMMDDGYDVSGGGYNEPPDKAVRFIPAVERDGVQSVVAPIAYKLNKMQEQTGTALVNFVARSEAVGGGQIQELLPNTDPDYILENIGGSYQFGNFKNTLRKFFNECDRLGVKGRLVSVPFCQGNANRGNNYQQYYDLITKLFDYIRAEVAIYQSEPFIFQMIVPPLSSGGNPYHLTQAQIEMSREFRDVQLTASGMSAFAHDGLHFSSAGAIDIGVLCANALAEFNAGRNYSAPYIPLNSAQIIGDEIHLHVAGQDIQLELKNLSPINSYDNINPVPNYGVEWISNGTESITKVTVLPRLIIVKFDADMVNATGEIKVAHQINWDMNGGINPGDSNNAQRSNICSTEKIYNNFTGEIIRSYIAPFKQSFNSGV